ncbi:3-hydroxyacyl-CoA dehydrogenase family protein [Actinokineospora guangxiensis]|uniref:3-hydroxyacyl-CoA dehydrogenase family protein n=1 Tax=Actinokineospora guangxiensis TaxID=1490288 RepID=A0ABW0EJY3_9PSEU
MRVPVGVVGAGTIGAGLAQSLAQAGHPVTVVDPVPGAIDGARRRLRDGLRLARLLGRAPDPAASALVTWSADAADLAGAGFVFECAPERIAVKEALFTDLDAVCAPEAVLATVTSAVPVDRLAARTARPERVVGTHFMNPVPLKDTVEVVRGPRTSPDVLDAVLAVIAGMGKTGIVVADGPGFVINRVLMLTVNEAAAVLAAGTADAATVDAVFEGCLGHPMGPLRTGDLIGLDTVADTLDVLRECTGDPRFTPDPLLRRLVAEGRRGRKAGAGFHDYPSPEG